jgi:hypothetical protein
MVSFRVHACEIIESWRIVISPDRPFSIKATGILKPGSARNPATKEGKPLNDVVTIGIVFRNK